MKATTAFRPNYGLFVLFASLSLLLGGCLSIMSQSEKQEARQWIGKQFRVKADLYVFTADEDLVYMGANLGAEGVRELPQEVFEKNIGQETTNYRIVGVIRVGAVFTVENVRYKRTLGGKYISLIGNVAASHSYFKEVNAAFVQQDRNYRSPGEIELLPQLFESVK